MLRSSIRVAIAVENDKSKVDYFRRQNQKMQIIAFLFMITTGRNPLYFFTMSTGCCEVGNVAHMRKAFIPYHMKALGKRSQGLAYERRVKWAQKKINHTRNCIEK